MTLSRIQCSMTDCQSPVKIGLKIGLSEYSIYMSNNVNYIIEICFFKFFFSVLLSIYSIYLENPTNLAD